LRRSISVSVRVTGAVSVWPREKRPWMLFRDRSYWLEA
jgi:hypothetical protein